MVKYFEWEYLELMFSCAYVYVYHRTFIAPQQLVGLRVIRWYRIQKRSILKTFFDRISRIISAILGWLHGKLKFRVKDRRLWDRIVVLRAQKLAELGSI